MKILVTGSAGFIGRHTIKLLLEKGHNIIAVDRNGNDSFEGFINGTAIGSWKNDILDYGTIKYIFEVEKPDAVLHLAANSSLQKGIEDPVYDAQNNIIGTIKVLQAMKDNGCKRIVFASTSAVYAPQGDAKYFGEKNLIGPITPYGISKAACEMYIKASGLDYAILRYANVYGPGQKPLGENILIARALAYFSEGDDFQINGDGLQTRDFIYVEDVARANLMALESDANNLILNISSNKGTSVVDIVRKIWRFHFEDRLTKSTWPPFGPRIDGELRHVVMNNSLAQIVLGWKPTIDIDEGLQRTVEAWKAKTITEESGSSIPASP